MSGLRITRNDCGAWLIYVGGVLVFSSVMKSRALEYIEAIK